MNSGFLVLVAAREPAAGLAPLRISLIAGKP